MINKFKNENKKSVSVFAWASFLNDLGSDMIYPVWPLFVTSFLGANMAVLGLLDGVGEAFVSISKALSGYLSDKIRKRKIFIWSGYLFGSLSRVGYAFAPAWQWLLPLKILDRSGKIRAAPRDAFVADISTEQNRGGNFGLMKAMDNLGAVCGIIICLLLFEQIGFTNLFLLAALPSLASAFLIYKHIRENKASEQKLYARFTLKDLDANFKLFLFLNSVFTLGAFSYSFLLIFAGKSGFNAVYLPVFYLIITVTAAIFSLPMGKLSDKIGRKKLMLLAFLLWAAICVSLILSTTPVAIIAVFVLYGIHKAALETVQKTYTSELCPDCFRATGLGVFQMAIGICALPASVIAGVLWDKINMQAPFYLSLTLSLIACLLLFFVRETSCNGN
ncbi:MAG TPA: MFS transporter [Smithellaceae bacterium]|jgi:MFS family permease|nr:MFS transporter [Smithellaceae bacterium]HNZ31794.1 MFS transporter [Smithellaceae bacterium]HOD30994.1 MFS transporter [Smithellaceae bacterium]HOF76873.1 MFS transporter [Smithellaceae bacterium]HOM69657.1 MFS transporter [Smithellaceae bacterium]